VKVLVDTHTLVWMLHNSPELSPTARTLAADLTNDVLVSIGSAWELAIKHSLGKITLKMSFREFIEGAVRSARLAMLPITVDHLDRLGALPHHHRDPFDRLLVAQALVEGVPLLSRDENLDAYGVSRLW
jgi:PIN domain nuclease of toxin-antitoxin system